MSESNPTPEIKIATQEANGTITTPSKVEMKEFSSEDLALISRRLNVLRDNSASTLAQKENSLIAKKEKLEKMIADLKAEKADAEPGKDAKLTQDEVDHAITEDDFEKKAPPAEDKTQPKTIAEVQKILPENSPISQDVAKILDKNGIMPDGFLKKIFEFLHKHLGGSEISFDQSGMYNTVV